MKRGDHHHQALLGVALKLLPDAALSPLLTPSVMTSRWVCRRKAVYYEWNQKKRTHWPVIAIHEKGYLHTRRRPFYYKWKRIVFADDNFTRHHSSSPTYYTVPLHSSKILSMAYLTVLEKFLTKNGPCFFFFHDNKSFDETLSSVLKVNYYQTPR